MPTAVTLAANDDKLAGELAQAIGSASFRPYHSADVRGVEIGGAAKNVLAIAAGIVAGRGLGASAQAALTTRGFAELMRFGRAYGAKPETMMGFSGLGDLLLTCSSPQSRNFTFGVNLGRGQKPGRHSWRSCRRRLHRERCCWRWRASAPSTCRSRPPSRRLLDGKMTWTRRSSRC